MYFSWPKPGDEVLPHQCEAGDLVRLPDGRLAITSPRDSRSHTFTCLQSTQPDPVTGEYIYQSVHVDYDEKLTFVAARWRIDSILLRAQDVRDAIDDYLPTDTKMRYAYHES